MLTNLFSEEFWLPQGTHWSNVNADWNLFWTIPLLLGAFAICRIAVERCIAHPLGKHLKISDKKCDPPAENQLLWEAYKKNNQPKKVEITKLAEVVGWKPYNVYKWFWQARNCTKPSKLTRFKESCWRLSYHFLSFAFGIVVLYQESLLDIAQCFNGYPFNSHSTTVVVYCLTQLGFCSCMLLFQLISTIRKDAAHTRINFSRHLAAITLLAISHVTGMLKIGSTITLTHDISDVLVEVAYLLDYMQHPHLSRAMFVIYAITFFVTRLLIYPFWILWSIYFVLPAYLTLSPALKLTLALLLVLQVAHVYWFRHIAVMVWKSLKGHTAKEKPELSSDSESGKKNE